jgi:hypothetical protein
MMQVAYLLAMVFMVALQCTAVLAQSASSYGPEQRMTGVYFTNFENSVFAECSGKHDCKDWVKKGGAWVDCAPAACRDLKARVSRLNGSLMNNGEFTISFVGRRGPRHAKRFLNDRESTVLIEQILDLRRLPQ